MTRLGQHFLKDKRVLERIVSELKLSPTDTVVEIGPGHGELTKFILERSPKKVLAIERDEELARHLTRNFQKLRLVFGDALEELPKLTKNLKSYKLTGNIPYYITGKLLRVVGELENKPELIVLTIQKEVAERLVAKPPKMNLLAASVRFWGEPEIVRDVSPKSFHPKPKVFSSIIQIFPHEKQKSPEESDKYYSFIRALFKQPRKTILNNLTAGSTRTKPEVEEFLKSRGIEPKLRPQNLDIDTINNLSQSF